MTANVSQNGYLYVYCSDESNIDVLFDNLQLIHNRGPLTEETHYYPFGLTMAGISSKAAGGVENKKKYNGIELDEDLGIEEYEAYYRNLDPQTGRWWQIDPKLEDQESLSPYQSMANDPIRNSDPLGDEDGDCCKTLWHDIKQAINITADQLGLPTMLNDATGVVRTINVNANPLTPIVELVTGKSVESNLTQDKSRAISAGETLMVLLPVAKVEGTLAKVTEAAMTSTEEKATTTAVADYSHLADSKSVGPGKNFTSAQKKAIVAENMKRNDGVIKSDKSGIILDKSVQSKKGVSSNMNQAEIDHVTPKAQGGSNSFKNAQVLSKKENLDKSDH